MHLVNKARSDNDSPDVLRLLYVIRENESGLARQRFVYLSNSESLSMARSQRLLREACISKVYFDPVVVGLQEIAQGVKHEFFALDLAPIEADISPDLLQGTLGAMIELFQSGKKQGWAEPFPDARELDDWLPKDETGRFLLLGRLKGDCDVYFDADNPDEKRLWAGSAAEQVEMMKSLWNSLGRGDKPVWLTRDDIKTYEAKFNESARQAEDPRSSSDRPRG